MKKGLLPSLTEKTSALVMALSVPYYFIFNYFGLHLAGNMIIFFVASYAMPIMLYKFNYRKTAKVLLIVVATALLVFYSLVLGKDSGAYLVLISVVHVPLLLFKRNKNVNLLVFTTLLPIFGVFFLEAINYQLYFTHPAISEISMRLIHTFAVSTAFLFAVLSVYLFYMSNSKLLTEISQAHSELKTAYLELKDSQHQIETLNHHATYAMLTRSIAHEIKNPISLLLSASELASLEDMSYEETKEFIQTIKTASLRLHEISNNLLKFGTPVAKKKQSIDLTQLLDDVATLGQSEFKNKHIQLVKNYAPHLPSIFADPYSISQALINLIVNAIQAMPEGGTLTFTSQLAPEGVQVSISDTGLGIAKENLEHIFDESFTTKETNTGLGLRFVKKVAQEHGGTVRCDSELQKGTTFTLCFPAFKG